MPLAVDMSSAPILYPFYFMGGVDIFFSSTSVAVLSSPQFAAGCKLARSGRSGWTPYATIALVSLLLACPLAAASQRTTAALPAGLLALLPLPAVASKQGGSFPPPRTALRHCTVRTPLPPPPAAIARPAAARRGGRVGWRRRQLSAVPPPAAWHPSPPPPPSPSPTAPPVSVQAPTPRSTLRSPVGRVPPPRCVHFPRTPPRRS